MTTQQTTDQATDRTAAVTRADVAFPSGGVELSGWHFRAATEELAGPAGRPVVVMAHGLAGTKDSGLEPFARGLAAAGLDVLAFDYRGFGTSGGSPRQTVSMAGQLEDYRAALAAAKRLDGVDPDRLVLWGVSLAGGHVLAAGASRDDVAAVVALTPLVDGLAAGRLAAKHHKPSSMLRSTVEGVRSRVGAPRTMPVVARPGELGALTLEGCYEDYLAIAGPSWRNEIDAAVGLELGGHRPVKHAADLRCPLLVQIADHDRSAPPHAALKAAGAGRGEVRHYPCDHFDVYAGKDWFDAVLAHQVHFLRRHLAP
ncbi:alpha/beta hydrolase [Nocardioides abyssi]|uniref:Alpha/beta hydrolase n=1 Tax=Nocardioides abyssi TaxID=3058370 RepID=A0ABT8ERN3_9ACTN|nr:alpha/beta hydrolase [Nocardioides abyssi]MDN4160812.1 alpha/beta hydrolase [Nocardioides abyssi]